MLLALAPPTTIEAISGTSIDDIRWISHSMGEGGREGRVQGIVGRRDLILQKLILFLQGFHAECPVRV